VLRALLDWFKTGPDRPPVSADPAVVRRAYEKKRWGVFLSLTLGYSVFYVVRLNLAVAKKPMLDEGVFSASELGYIGSAMLGVYAVGRLFNGFLCDRANIRRFMAAALLLSGLTNLALGATTWFVAFALLWGLNGWFQTVGAAPSGASLRQWFPPSVYGTRYGVWSSSHGIGSAVTYVATSALVAWLGWRWGFWGPGLFAAAAALVLFRTLADRPEACGLPNVHDLEGVPRPASLDAASVGRLQLQVLRDSAIWRIGLAAAAMYVARYGVNSWGALYLQEAKRYSLVAAGTWLGIYTTATVVGAVASGWLSDRLFGARRDVPSLICGVVEVGALVAFYLIPAGHEWLDAVALSVFGFALGALLAYLGGLWAVDLSPPRAAGAAMGIIGFFSYVGASIQDAVSGVLIDGTKQMVAGVATYDFRPAFVFWIATSVVSIVLVLSVWNAKPRS